jgi:hypothetical protein
MFANSVFAQTAILRGVVTDESGALVPGATVIAKAANTAERRATANDRGAYEITGLPEVEWSVIAEAPGLAMLAPVKIQIKPGAQTLDLTMKVAARTERLEVEDTGNTRVSTEASANASALIIRGQDLDALSDNPTDLAADLQALAGPAAGPNGGSIYIDGFSGGELPPKNAIREIRINQNPFSPEFDRLGFGRIEIFTKPGSDKFHADLGYNFADSFWNSRNPYAGEKAPFLLNEIRSGVSGPINSRASFNFIIAREWVDNGNVINGVILDPALVITPYDDVYVSTLRRTTVTPRIDYQLSQNHTLTVRYSFNRDAVENAGVGAFNLQSRGYSNDARSHTLQLTETAVLNPTTINETRFQFYRPTVVSEANESGYALQVLQAFNGGGNPLGRSTFAQNNYELQNITSIVRPRHLWKFGVRLRGTQETNVSPTNFAGTFTFSGLVAPKLDANDRPVLDPTGQPVLIDITSIESYRRTLLFQQQGLTPLQIRALGGGASQFTIESGNPLVSGSQFDIGAFVGDDWKLRPNLTLSLGARYEWQTNIGDSRDLSARVGVAWAPGAAGKSKPKSVIRAGFGIFYDRFSLANTLAAERYDGVRQQQYVVYTPNFFPRVPNPSELSGPLPSSTVQVVDSDTRAPYLLQTAIGYERQLPLNTSVAITYANSRGVHMLRSENTNAPLPGTFNPAVPGSGVYPLGRPGLVVLMQSTGIYNQNQLIVNFNSRLTRDVSLTGSYGYNVARSNTDGLGTFPAQPYSMLGEYGPAATDIRHRVSLGGTVTAKWGIRFNPLLTANTGPPFDITTGRDNYGSTLFNARPGFANDPTKPGLILTSYGLLDPRPSAGQALVPRNYGRGPGQIMLNMRVGRTFNFGSTKEGGGAPSSQGGGGGPGSQARGPQQGGPFVVTQSGPGGASTAKRYSLTVSMQIRNLLNHNNPGPIIGNVTSPLFGFANQPAGSTGAIFSENANNRRLELQMRLTF